MKVLTSPTRTNLSLLDSFKSKIKIWHCDHCPFNIWRIFVDGLGFINLKYGEIDEVYSSIDKYPGCVRDLSREFPMSGFLVPNFI